MAENRKYTFWTFIQENKLEIPVIQRDYAQGRKSKKDLRKSILTNIKNALDENNELKLDFVYGVKEKDILNLLDGQQRLTTLWLVHWYIALKAGKLLEAATYLNNFSYETRISSRNFCKSLCKPELFTAFCSKQDNEQDSKKDSSELLEYIKNQTWFYSAWLQDPTIQSMLTMLCGSAENKWEDSIEHIFKDADFAKYWEKLTTKEKCQIIFYYLPLAEFKLTDDLYVKMNARGEQLSDYENLKADLIKYVEKQKKVEEQKNDGNNPWQNLEKELSEKKSIEIDLEQYLAQQFDTTWTDLFWKKRNEENCINEIYFCFLNRFFLNFYLKNSDDSLYNFLSNEDTLSYTTLENYKLNGNIDPDFFKSLINVLYNYATSMKDADLEKLFQISWDNKFHFIPEYDTENNKTKKINRDGEEIFKTKVITQLHRVIFYVVCKYFEQGPIDENAISLKRWMRFVWNLVSDSISNISDMKSAIKLINKVENNKVENTHNVYEQLAKIDIAAISENSNLARRFKEECIKAKKIYNTDNNSLNMYDGELEEFKGKTWEEVLITAESYFNFKGFIPFLYNDEKGDICWDDFDTKWEHIKAYFDTNSVRGKYKDKAILLKTFISYFDDWELFKGMCYDNNSESWKKLLTDPKWQMPIHSLLKTSKNLNDGTYQMCDTEAFTANNNLKDEYKKVQEQLVKTNLLEHIAKEEGYSFYHNEKILHKYYHKYNIFLGDSFHENELLAKLSDDKIIFPISRVRDTVFFKDYSIDFIYNRCFFKLTEIKEQNKLVIYLYRCENNKFNSFKKDKAGKAIHVKFDENIFLTNLDDLIDKEKSLSDNNTTTN